MHPAHPISSRFSHRSTHDNTDHVCRDHASSCRAPSASRRAVRQATQDFTFVSTQCVLLLSTHFELTLQPRHAERQRLVIIEVKATETDYFRIALPDAIIRNIPSYTRLLTSALNAAGPSKTPRIRDENRYDQDSYIHVADFLMGGYLPQLDYSQPETYSETLQDLVDMYNVAAGLKLYEVGRAIVFQLEHEHLMDLELFLDFAAYVYRGRTGKTAHPPTGMLGKAIKRRLVYFLPQLRQGGLATVTKRAGETLKNQLLEVMMENLGGGGEGEGGDRD